MERSEIYEGISNVLYNRAQQLKRGEHLAALRSTKTLVELQIELGDNAPVFKMVIGNRDNPASLRYLHHFKPNGDAVYVTEAVLNADPDAAGRMFGAKISSDNAIEQRGWTTEDRLKIEHLGEAGRTGTQRFGHPDELMGVALGVTQPRHPGDLAVGQMGMSARIPLRSMPADDLRDGFILTEDEGEDDARS